MTIDNHLMLPESDAHHPLQPQHGHTRCPSLAEQPEVSVPKRVALADRCCATAALEAPRAIPAAHSGSRRRRLWELGSHAHCPVIGVCLPMSVLRRLAAKALGGPQLADDYTLHSGTVHDCQQRNALAEAVQRELDRRYLLPLRQSNGLKTTEALAQWWQAEAAAHRLPGALWATLTHPRCGAELAKAVLGQVHMLQHQVGIAGRADQARFEALLDENAVLAQALAAAQQRSSQQAAEHAERQQAQQAELVRLRGKLLAVQSAQAQAQEALDSLRSRMPELASREALVRQNHQLQEQLDQLRRLLRHANDDTSRLRDRLAHTTTTPGASAGADAVANSDAVTSAPPSRADRPSTPLPSHTAVPPTDGALAHQAVLCVGGRTASVPVYRRMVERLGARFLHHDGGDEQADARLEATLAAADLVICQAGCVSHNAYWRVKDHCKRTGKRCVYVDTPSASGLQRALAQIGDGH